ncbi:hypothetical protein D0Z08_21540 [Nocardioides immobilis]|uniref:Uncharacterized protein n=1 Tax=Nocardioides immobilis TaxID=2049295 RepID=A0A417XXY5_9ACTN|nr:hypothetical protein D0Z08_21540 [Nocardioides immobilis]
MMAASMRYDATGRLLPTGLVGNLGPVLLGVVSRMVAAAAPGLLLTSRNRERGGPGVRRWVAGAVALALPLVVAAGVTGTAHHHDQVSEADHAAR